MTEPQAEGQTEPAGDRLTFFTLMYADREQEIPRHSAHLTQEDAARAGAELARKLWASETGDAPFPEVTDDEEAMNVARGACCARLEIETIEASAEVIRGLYLMLQQENEPGAQDPAPPAAALDSEHSFIARVSARYSDQMAGRVAAGNPDARGGTGMPSPHAIEAMAEKAKYRAGWTSGLERRPLVDGDGLGAVQLDIDVDKERRERAYAEGVEAALRWALGHAGEPLPR